MHSQGHLRKSIKSISIICRKVGACIGCFTSLTWLVTELLFCVKLAHFNKDVDYFLVDFCIILSQPFCCNLPSPVCNSSVCVG